MAWIKALTALAWVATVQACAEKGKTRQLDVLAINEGAETIQLGVTVSSAPDKTFSVPEKASRTFLLVGRDEIDNLSSRHFSVWVTVTTGAGTPIAHFGRTYNTFSDASSDIAKDFPSDRAELSCDDSSCKWNDQLLPESERH